MNKLDITIYAGITALLAYVFVNLDSSTTGNTLLVCFAVFIIFRRHVFTLLSVALKLLMAGFLADVFVKSELLPTEISIALIGLCVIGGAALLYKNCKPNNNITT